MKRSVAILGPTPPFVRWAIRHPCRFRELEADNLPDSTFRQLRNLRTLSEGINDRRVRNGICFHPDNRPESPELARGFPVDEILQVFGSRELVQATCETCPANAIPEEAQKGADTSWAGCYGMLPLDLGWVSSSNPRKLKSDHSLIAINPAHDLAILCDNAIEKLNIKQDLQAIFQETTPQLNGMFTDHVFNPARSAFAARVLHAVEFPATAPEQNRIAYSHLISALEKCEERLPVHIEIVPAGFSDGSSWTIRSHCSRCRSSEPQTHSGLCPVCHLRGGRQSEIRSKVLGLRPYMLLHQVLGLEKTQELLSQNRPG